MIGLDIEMVCIPLFDSLDWNKPACRIGLRNDKLQISTKNSFEKLDMFETLDRLCR